MKGGRGCAAFPYLRYSEDSGLVYGLVMVLLLYGIEYYKSFDERDQSRELARDLSAMRNNRNIMLTWARCLHITPPGCWTILLPLLTDLSAPISIHGAETPPLSFS